MGEPDPSTDPERQAIPIRVPGGNLHGQIQDKPERCL